MKNPDVEVTSMASFMEGLIANFVEGQISWYRGHSRLDWSLIPSIARSAEHLRAELTMIKVFKQQARPVLQSLPGSEWEWIFLMQHHGAPTRLLDWSENPLVALYFALDDPRNEHAEQDSVVWCLDPVGLNRHAGFRHEFSNALLAFDVDNSLESYLPFNIRPNISRMEPVAAIGPQNSRRMAAQSGTFTIMHADVLPIEGVEDGRNVWRMIIPARCKNIIRRDLSILRVVDFTFFPDLDRVAASVKRLIG